MTGLPAPLLDRLRKSRWTAAEWTALLRVAVSDDAPAVLGTYAVADDRITFSPAFPFDPGRQYAVRFDPSKLPDAPPGETVVAHVALPARSSPPTTVVEQVYPSGDQVPENLLRLYIEFSAPMGQGRALDHIRLLDDKARAVEDVFLPFEDHFWSPDRRRFTVFFDPGLVKDGILPNRQRGRPLKAGRTYTLVIDREWRDGDGQPLKDEYRRVFKVGPARTQSLDTATWVITPPPSGSVAPLVVTFREPLDRGLLMRALGVRRYGAPVAGEIQVEVGERRWMFTPARPWSAGAYDLLALSILEDIAGNQIGRAFEVENFDTVDKDPDPKTVLLPFTVKPATS